MIIANGRVDPVATCTERERLSADRRPLAAFAFGPEREAHEARWSNAASAALASAVLAAPAGLRPYLLAATKQRLAAHALMIDVTLVAQTVRDVLTPLQVAAVA